MPKSYSQRERDYIQARLKEEAAKCLAQYGIRRTTVDELVKRVKIPKGTFYLFYRSKELLLFEVILEQHEAMEQALYGAVRSLDPALPLAPQLTELLFRFYKMAGELPVLKQLGAEEVELLARKLPPETVAEHMGQDDALMEKMFAALPVKPEADPKVFSAAFHTLFFASLHREEIGVENYDEALRLLLYGLVKQLI